MRPRRGAQPGQWPRGPSMLPFPPDPVDRSHDAAPVAAAGLPGAPALEAALADDRRASLESSAPVFDPGGLYALEVERDEALDDLAAHLPPNASIRLARHHVAQRVAGAWEAIDGWVASVTSA